jgi:hypothetical protein
MSKYPSQFKVYKKIGAAQFGFIRPKQDAQGRIEKDGAILLEVAKSKGEKSYDWSNKISFAIGLSDLTNIFEDTNAHTTLIHTMPSSPITKKLEIQPGEGRYQGTFKLVISEFSKDKSVSKTVMVPLSGGEYNVLLRLFVSAAPSMIGW